MGKTIAYLFCIICFFSCVAPDKKEEDKGGAADIVTLVESLGVVNFSVCNMRRNNDFSSEMITQAMLGMPVKLKQENNWLLVQTPDNYEGWVYPSAITRMTKAEYDAWNATEKVVVTAHYGSTYEQPDTNSQPVSDVVGGNRLILAGIEGGFYKVLYPDGREAYISQDLSMCETEWRSSLKQDAASIIRTARSLIGVPYLWAGTSSKGMDCSGYVRTVLFMHDIIIPRDAYQQAAVGESIDIASDFENLQPADLIFFGRKATANTKERVIHVGIYLGDRKFIHSQGDIHISSFDPSDPAYDAFNLNRLLYARRLLNQIGQAPEITTTQTNPYYLPQ